MLKRVCTAVADPEGDIECQDVEQQKAADRPKAERRDADRSQPCHNYAGHHQDAEPAWPKRPVRPDDGREDGTLPFIRCDRFAALHFRNIASL